MLSCFWPVNFQNRRKKKKSTKRKGNNLSKVIECRFEFDAYLSIWMHCIQCLSLFFFFLPPFVKSKNIVVLRKVYPKFSLFFCFSIWCFASYAFDWDSFCCSCLFVCVSSFVRRLLLIFFYELQSLSLFFQCFTSEA